MASGLVNVLEEHHSITWPVTSFTVDHDFKSANHAYLLLDRANSEFGLFYHIAPGVGLMAQLTDDEPVYFQVSRMRAACSRPGQTCKKVCVLMQHYQIDLEFTTADHASDFLHSLGRLATKVSNLSFEVFEAQSLSALNRTDFDIEKMCDTTQAPQSWMAVSDADTFGWAAIYKTGKCSDFTIVAGHRSFPVHRILLCTRSQYFNAVCDGHFAETEQKSISLPESVETVCTMLHELYNVYNPTTGSIFTNFALRREIEKEFVMKNLLELFIACDKYNLESIKKKIANAIIDRLPFVHSALGIVDLAASIYDESCPQIDCSLRKAIISQIQARLPIITSDEATWEAYSENKAVLKALHECQCAMMDEVSADGILTPPISPIRTEKKHKAQERSSGG